MAPSRRGRSRDQRKRSGSEKGKAASSANSPCAGARRYFTGELTEFELFCAYHLGIERNGAYRPRHPSEVARRFGIDDEGIRTALQDFRMDPERVRQSSFDLELAKLDIEVAPAGIDRVELARTIFQDFLDAGCGVGPVPAWNPLDNEPPTPSESEA